jgi:alpha-tubulin suppressor-like RCC1 family protein
LNTNTQLGDGTSTNRLTPVAIGGTLRFTNIDLGRFHSCALTSAGAVYCWGANTYGQLGDGTTTSRPTPTRSIQ